MDTIMGVALPAVTDDAAAEQIERKKSKRDLLEKIRSLTRE